MLYDDISSEKMIDIKKYLVDKTAEITIPILKLEGVRIKYVFFNEPHKKNSFYQSGVNISKSKRYDYIMRFFNCKQYQSRELKHVVFNIILSTIHELRHIYQIENNMYPEMSTDSKIPYDEREWEIDASKYATIQFSNNKKLFTEYYKEALKIVGVEENE